MICDIELFLFRSDESDPEDQDTVERDAMLLAQTFANQDKV